MAMVGGLGKGYSAKDVIVDEKYLYYGTWKSHTEAWMENPYSSDILTVRYEDLRLDPLRELQRVMKFAKLDRDDQILEKSIKGNEIEKMRAKELTMGFDKSMIKRKKWDEKAMFNRNGIVGSFKSELGIEFVEHIERTSKNEMMAHAYFIDNVKENASNL